MLDRASPEARKMASPTMKAHFILGTYKNKEKCLWTGYHPASVDTPSTLNLSKDEDHGVIHKSSIKFTASETSSL